VKKTNLIDLVGRQFGRLTVIRRAESKTFPCGLVVTYWECRCECGVIKAVHGGSLRNGNTKSCGCFRVEVGLTKNRTHGRTKTAEHNTWLKMKARCENNADKSWHRYGGRGITVCAEWANSFEAFYADMGPRPSSAHSIERNDNDGNYCPENCRWATKTEQANNRRSSRIVEFDGVQKTVAEWARDVGMSPLLLRRRIEDGWSIEDALTKASRGVRIKRDDPLLTSGHRTQRLSEWAAEKGIEPATMHARIRRGWSDEKVVETPLRLWPSGPSENPSNNDRRSSQ